ncbi:hypothetical protein MKY64_14770 [Paenibacillus sp. FSL R7-0210]|uniref:hypothetical protein n=1 Tax=Paenibacillus sp. FSL R7-0210 TaxID=2921676 RepID=UPI0030F60518
MNTSTKLQCEVCNNVVLLKVYGGYVHENRFAFNCPECNITISGYWIWNEDVSQGFVKEFKCNNANRADETSEPSHILQLATEFFTFKIKPYSLSDPTIFLSPYILEQMSSRRSQEKSSLVRMIAEGFDEEYKVAMRIWELFQNKNFKYLDRQLISNHFVEKPRLAVETLNIDYPKVIQLVIINLFSFIFNKQIYLDKLQELRKMLQTLFKKNPQEMIALRNDLSELVTYADRSVVQLLKNFAQYFRLLWPIILSDLFGPDDIQKIKEKQGILTTNFDMLKNYYVEAYEALGSVLPLLLGIQNIKIRADRNKFEPSILHEFNKLQTIKDFEKQIQNKGNRIKFFVKENIFSPLLEPTILDNIIRNSIGHHSYDYKADQQLIRFKDKNRNHDLFLIEFGNLLYKSVFATLAAFEISMFLKYEVPEDNS